MNAKAASRANAPGPRQCLALLSSLAILLVSANFVTLHAASSGGFASVTIKDQTKDDIIVTTAKVFTADGYRSGRSGSGQMVFEKEASRGRTPRRPVNTDRCPVQCHAATVSPTKLVKAPTTVSKVLLADDRPGVMHQAARIPRARSRKLLIVAVLSGAVALTGCKHLGPKTVAVDRFDYSSAIAESWKQQTLLNIVKLRYLDLPVFVDVASIVSGYSLQTGVSVNGTVSSENAVQGNYASMGGHAIYTDRPTVTYVPLTGEKFLRGLITPIDPKHIFFMLQAGYSDCRRTSIDSLSLTRPSRERATSSP